MRLLIITLLLVFISCGFQDLDNWPDQCFDVGQLKCRDGVKTYCNWNLKYFDAYICPDDQVCNTENDGESYCTNDIEMWNTHNVSLLGGYIIVTPEVYYTYRCCIPKED